MPLIPPLLLSRPLPRIEPGPGPVTGPSGREVANLMSQPDGSTRGRLVHLGIVPVSRGLPAGLTLFRPPHLDPRMMMASSSNGGAKAPTVERIPHLTEIFYFHQDPRVRGSAANALGLIGLEYPEAKERIIQILEEGRERERNTDVLTHINEVLEILVPPEVPAVRQPPEPRQAPVKEVVPKPPPPKKRSRVQFPLDDKRMQTALEEVLKSLPEGETITPSALGYRAYDPYYRGLPEDQRLNQFTLQRYIGRDWKKWVPKKLLGKVKVRQKVMVDDDAFREAVKGILSNLKGEETLKPAHVAVRAYKRYCRNRPKDQRPRQTTFVERLIDWKKWIPEELWGKVSPRKTAKPRRMPFRRWK